VIGLSSSGQECWEGEAPERKQNAGRRGEEIRRGRDRSCAGKGREKEQVPCELYGAEVRKEKASHRRGKRLLTRSGGAEKSC